MPLPIVPAPMTTTALATGRPSEGEESAIDGLRALERRALRQLGLPVGEARRRLAPADRAEAVVQIAERAADRDVADRQRGLGERQRLVVELLQAGVDLQHEGGDQR